jgi:maleylacetoacetate isomerase
MADNQKSSSAEIATATSEPAAKKMKVSPDQSVVLHSYWRSTCSWRVRIALATKGIKYDYKSIHLVKNEQMSDEFTVMNPSQELPVLQIDGHALSQSGAIIEYLEETRPEPALLPKSAADKAHVRRICDIIAAGIQSVQNLRILRYVIKDLEGEAKDAAKQGWANHWITHGFVALERVLATTSGKFCVGDEVTMADLFLVPQIFNANRYKVDMSKFPIITKIAAACNELPAFKAAIPEAQPDAQ